MPPTLKICPLFRSHLYSCAGYQGVAAAIPTPSISNGILHPSQLQHLPQLQQRYQQLHQQNPHVSQHGINRPSPHHQPPQQQQQTLLQTAQQQHHHQHRSFVQASSHLDDAEKSENCTICMFELGEPR